MSYEIHWTSGNDGTVHTVTAGDITGAAEVLSALRTSGHPEVGFEEIVSRGRHAASPVPLDEPLYGTAALRLRDALKQTTDQS